MLKHPPIATRMAQLMCYLFLGSILVLHCASAESAAELVDRVMAIVNEDIILMSDLEAAMAPVRVQLKKSGMSEIEQRIALENQKAVMLDQLINEKLTDQQAERNGIHVSQEEVDRAIERILAVNRFSEAELKRLLKLDGIIFEDYRKQIHDQILQSKIVNREVKSKVVITDEDVTAYYEAHKDQYAGQIKYHLKHLLMRYDPDGAGTNSRAYEQMQQIYKRLQAGESFDSLTKVYSQSTTAEQGGDLGVFESRLLAAPIQKAVERLSAGQFTPVLETEQGYQIFYVQEVMDVGGKPLAEASAEIQDKLYAERVEEKFKAWLTELRQRAHIQILE